MSKSKLAPDSRRRRYSRWLHLVLAGTIGLGVGIGQGVAVAATDAVDATGRPIITKSSRDAALKAATEALLRQDTTTRLSGPVTQALPTLPTDLAVVPHYFGPWPNWANSPFTLPDAHVQIDGNGAGATAAATVGANGAVTGITITNPGSGYTVPPTVTITDSTGTNTSATATATIALSLAVSAIDVTAGGQDYTQPVVDILDPTGSGALAIAYGGVEDNIVVTNPGSGYKNPTVDFDMPDGPDGVKAAGYALCDGNAPPTPPDTTYCGATGAITGIVVTQPGSGYSFAPNVVIRDGTIFEPTANGGANAAATSTLYVQTVAMDAFGSGYTNPTVDIFDAGGIGSGALATATLDLGAVTAITVTNPGSGYVTAGGIKKFVDTLPGLCNPAVAGSCAAAANNLGQYIPLAVPDTTAFPGSDYYVIAVVQQRECMSSSLPGCTPLDNPKKGTLHRKYVQLSSPGVIGTLPLDTDLLDGTSVATTLPAGVTGAVTEPHFLGPVIVAQKDRPVRIKFYNLLPTGSGGDLYIPSDSTLMGAGFVPSAWRELTDEGTVMDEVRNTPCTQSPKGATAANPTGSPADCFKDNRATLHLHGGLSPWISDGTPHQWITPAGEVTSEPQGASVSPVPDMPGCDAANDGCMTFYYTNQQSARLMFYHDHAFGTTRLNVYLGEAAGYVIRDATEQRLIKTATNPTGVIPEAEIPLIIQDRTFVPSNKGAVGDPLTQLELQDPTWDLTRWGGAGDFWYHHVYMPAQNPGDPSGMSAYGRWMYGPWFWPAATPPHGPIANPYYDPACILDDPGTHTYPGIDPFCEPRLIPGTPNISAGMEQFNDTPLVNGTVYPTLTVEPKAYRLRVLNAANDRFFNLSLYVADPTTVSTGTNALGQPIGGTEVALNEAELAAAQIDPVVFPTPDTVAELVILPNGNTGPDPSVSLPGPSWIQIGTEGGFLPAPVVVPPQPTTWITDPTRFDVGNVDLHSLLLAPAERADVIVDFSQFAGKTLIVYNDAPAAFPARVPSYDYYTGAPDLSPNGAPAILPGYGPSTRTVMQIKVAGTPSPAFNLRALQRAFSHKADGTGAFEEGQHPIIVGQAAYNSAYGTSFWASGDCTYLGSVSTRCDGYARIDEEGGTPYRFNTLTSTTNPATGRPTSALEVMLEPKAIHDEMNSATFDEFGRMTANMGLTTVPAGAALLNLTLYPYVNPPTEMIDGTNLPRVQFDGLGKELEITPISVGDDGTQIWKITHNGVDTHPLHFHLYDVQLLNRVAWDNIISVPDRTELGWKDTVRVNPLQDTIVALRPVVPSLPWELPNSVRPLNPALPTTGPGSFIGFNSTDAQGNPTALLSNQLVNLGWEYVWHCHILSHEEMDMMRPQSLALPPIAPTNVGLAIDATGVTISWTDASITETGFVVQRSLDQGLTWSYLMDTTVNPPVPLVIPSTALGDPNLPGLPYSTKDTDGSAAYMYRVGAQNTVGFGVTNPGFMSLSVQGWSAGVAVRPIANVAPTSLTFVPDQLVGTTSAAQTVTLSNTGNALLENIVIGVVGDFAVSSTDCGTSLAALASCTISVTFTPTDVGPRAGTLAVASNDPVNPTLTVPLSGTGTVSQPVAVVAPTSLAFGNQGVGTTSAAQTVTLSNTGNALLENIVIGVVGDFAVSSTDCGTSLAALASCTISVTFTPTVVAPLTGTLSIASNDTLHSPLTVGLSGTGTNPLPILYLSLSNDTGTLTGLGLGGTNLAYTDEDILGWNGTSYTMVFDGSDPDGNPATAGLPSTADISAFDIDPANNRVLMSFRTSTVVPGFGNSGPGRIFAYNLTTGVFSLFFDGQDVGLLANPGEYLDAVQRLADGRILVSTQGNPIVPGLSNMAAADLLVFSPVTLGATTTGTWAQYLDASDLGVGLTENGENTDGVAVAGNGDIYLSTLGSFAVPGNNPTLFGQKEDVFVCHGPTTGPTSACSSFSLFFDGTAHGLATDDVDAIDLP